MGLTGEGCAEGAGWMLPAHKALWQIRRGALIAASAMLAVAAIPALALTSTTTTLASATNPTTVGQGTVLTATMSPTAATDTATFNTAGSHSLTRTRTVW